MKPYAAFAAFFTPVYLLPLNRTIVICMAVTAVAFSASFSYAESMLPQTVSSPPNITPDTIVAKQIDELNQIAKRAVCYQFPKSYQSAFDEYLAKLKDQPEKAEEIVLGLAKVMPENFVMFTYTVEHVLLAIDEYKGQRTQTQTDALVESYGALLKKWTQQKQAEQKSSSSCTIWDLASESDVATLSDHFEKTICDYRPGPQKKWQYVYISQSEINNWTPGEPQVITCVQ